MKKAIILPLMMLLCCAGLSLKSAAATIGLAGGSPPAGVTVSIDSYNNITVTSSYGYTLYRADFTRNSPYAYWSVAMPASTFYSEGANIVSLGWLTPGYPGQVYAHYYITY
jgi:hypothetical protein